jgi:hypothetical protein
MDEAAILAFMAAMNVTREQAIAILTAAGAGVSGGNDVYIGDKVTKKGKKAPARPTAPGVSDLTGMGGEAEIVATNTKSAEEMYSEFWSNPSVQNQVMGYLQLIGRSNSGKPGAYEIWKDIVDQAAEIYRGGKGPKITPFELLNMSMQGASATDVSIQRQIREYDEGTLTEIAQALAVKNRGKKLNDVELQEALDMADKIIQKGVVTKTEKVRNPKTGKLENVSKTTGGFSQEKFESKLTQKFEEETPELLARRQAFEGLDMFQKIMSGGII